MLLQRCMKPQHDLFIRNHIQKLSILSARNNQSFHHKSLTFFSPHPKQIILSKRKQQIILVFHGLKIFCQEKKRSGQVNLLLFARLNHKWSGERKKTNCNGCFPYFSFLLDTKNACLHRNEEILRE